jgi:hypothetical protein
MRKFLNVQSRQVKNEKWIVSHWELGRKLKIVPETFDSNWLERKSCKLEIQINEQILSGSMS